MIAETSNGVEIAAVTTRGGDTSLTLTAAFTANLGSATNYVIVQVEQPHVVRRMLRHIQSGLDRFYSCHTWFFLTPWKDISTVATYSTGTITVSAGVVTFSTALPSTEQGWIADGEIVIAGTAYEVNTYDNTTQVTLVDTTVTAAAGTTFTARQKWYDLPDDFAGFAHQRMYYRHGDGQNYAPPTLTDAGRLHEMWQQLEDYTFRPTYFCVRVKTHDATAGTRYQVGFWHIPNAVYKFYYKYRVRLNEMSPTNKYPAGSQEHSMAMEAAIMFEALRDLSESEAQTWYQDFERYVEKSKRLEAEYVAADNLGYNSDRRYAHVRPGEVPTYSWPGLVKHSEFTLYNPG